MNYPSFGAASTVCKINVSILCMVLLRRVGLDLFIRVPGSSVGIATDYGLDGLLSNPGGD
jgi:hypothetical protein